MSGIAPVSFAQCLSAFHTGADSPRDFLERALDVIDAREPAVQAFVELNADAARLAADAASERYRAGKPMSLVDGCPIGIKDIIETCDFPTQMNNAHFSGWYSGRDAACVQSLRAAGAVILGKTQTTEFAIGNSAPTTNPVDERRTPGGSSSGSAAAVGAGMLPAALGTQTAGSVLRPASFCGTVGFKPTHGTLSLAGIHPLSHSLDHLGTLSATLADAWHTAHVVWAGAGSNDASKSIPGPGLPPVNRPSRGLVWLRTDGWTDLDKPTEQIFEAAVAAIRAAGVNVITADDDAQIRTLERALQGVGELNTDIVRFEIRYPMTVYRARDAALIGPRISALLAEGDSMSVTEHVAALKRRDKIRSSVAPVAARFDGFLTMASTGPAPLGHQYTGDRTFLSPWSVVGGPAFSLPVLEVDGLPVGLQLMGDLGEDAALASIAQWLMALLSSE